MIKEHARKLEGDVKCVEYCDPQAIMRDPLVSVMMATYNHAAPYIGQAIEGVLSQKTSFPIELVIGEDQSTDATRQIVLDYANQHPSIIRVVSSESNVGARRNGWRTHWSCRGKYLAICEGDDYWHDPLKLEKQIKMLEADDEMVLVHTDVDFFYQLRQVRIPQFQRRRGFRFDESLSRKQRFDAILLGAEICYTPTVVYRLAIMHEIMREDRFVFQDTYFPMGDTSRWLELSLRGRFGYLDESTTTFRRIAESATRGKDYQRLAQFTLKSIELRLYYKQKYGTDGEVQFNRQISRMGLDVLYRACIAGDPNSACQLRELLPQMDWVNWSLYCVAMFRPLNALFRSCVWLPLSIRRYYRKIRFGIESSI